MFRNVETGLISVRCTERYFVFVEGYADGSKEFWPVPDDGFDVALYIGLSLPSTYICATMVLC